MKSEKVVFRAVKDLNLLPENPRKITKADFKRLCDSIKFNGFWPHRPLAIIERDGRYITLCGNQRLKAAQKLGIKEVPTILYTETTEEEEKDLVLRDNVNNGEWDFDALTIDDTFSDVDFEAIGIEIPEVEEPKKAKKNRKEEDEDESEEEEEENVDNEVSFYKSMYKDVLYDSDNDFEIPNLLSSMQAEHVELPITPWGANSRLRKDVSTYHFYVDDYRFENLFKNPINLLTSGVKAIVEPNCSCHDQTPIAWGMQLIYKKRWFARYCQECGIKVYVDLNVSHKFIEYNKKGIPKGYNAFFTRGTDGWLKSLELDLKVAQEISGLERPNLNVYGGGKEIKKFCQEHGILYITDFINERKISING